MIDETKARLVHLPLSFIFHNLVDVRRNRKRGRGETKVNSNDEGERQNYDERSFLVTFRKK